MDRVPSPTSDLAPLAAVAAVPADVADGVIHPAHAAEKIAQARAELESRDIDVWLTFVRRTDTGPDPVLPIILGRELSFPSALIIPRAGLDALPTAIVSHYQVAMVRETEAWPTIISFVDGASDAVRQTLIDLEPRQIAINTSQRDPGADGLSHAMWQILQNWLDGTDLAERLISSEDVVAAVRGCKTPRERAALGRTIEHTDAVLQSAVQNARPGMTERDLAALVHRHALGRGLSLAWDPALCPSITTGPESTGDGGQPSPSLRITEGCVLHVDLGLRCAGYCSDIKRCWYVPSAEAPTPPDSVARAFDSVRASIDAAMDALRPGAVLSVVDEAARTTLLAAGYSEYAHGTGHQIGRAVHDGGGIIGPRWERYGDAVQETARPGQVFTLELGVQHPDAGYIGLEEMVVVTDDGCTSLSQRQTELWTLGEPRDRLC